MWRREERYYPATAGHREPDRDADGTHHDVDACHDAESTVNAYQHPNSNSSHSHDTTAVDERAVAWLSCLTRLTRLTCVRQRDRGRRRWRWRRPRFACVARIPRFPRFVWRIERLSSDVPLNEMSEHRITFDTECYSVDAVERALYRLSDRFASDVAVDEGVLRCTLFLRTEDPEQVAAAISDLRNEVLDETLRARIRDETKEVRNLILALAFSNTGLVDPQDA